MIKPNRQHAAEQRVHEQIDAHDDDTCSAYAEHCATWVDNSLVLSLCLSIIQSDNAKWLNMMMHVRRLCPAFDVELERLVVHIERHRAEFIEEEAENRIKAADAEDQSRAEFSAECRRMA